MIPGKLPFNFLFVDFCPEQMQMCNVKMYFSSRKKLSILDQVWTLLLPTNNDRRLQPPKKPAYFAPKPEGRKQIWHDMIIKSWLVITWQVWNLNCKRISNCVYTWVPRPQMFTQHLKFWYFVATHPNVFQKCVIAYFIGARKLALAFRAQNLYFEEM